MGVHSERFLPGTGQWHYSGHFAGTAIQLLANMAQRQRQVADVILQDNGKGEKPLALMALTRR